jgi:DNA-directed RNA polymerase specialized sigma24 family protein
MSSFARRCVSPKLVQEKAFQAAWEDLVGRYGALLRVQVRRQLRNAGLAPTGEQVEERVQEVYYRLLLGGAGRLRLLRRWSERRVVTYLSKVAERVVVDEFRSKAAVKRGGSVRLSFHGSLSEVAEWAVDPRGTPEEQALLTERLRLVLRGCRRVADAMDDRRDRGRCLRILRLAILEGWSSHEIVRSEGGCASSVDSLVHRARRRLARGGLALPSRRAEGVVP